MQECTEALKTLQSLLREKKKKYSDEELQSKYERLERLNMNLEVLQNLYSDQNSLERQKLGLKTQSSADIENQMMFMSRKDIITRNKELGIQED